MYGITQEFKGMGTVDGVDALVFIHLSRPFIIDIEARLVDVQDAHLIATGSASAFNEMFIKAAVRKACRGL